MHGARAVCSVWCGEQGPVLRAGVTLERGGKNWFLLSAGRGLALTRVTRDIASTVIRPRSDLSSYALAQVGSMYGQKRKNPHLIWPCRLGPWVVIWLGFVWCICTLPVSLVSASPVVIQRSWSSQSAFRSAAVTRPTRAAPWADPKRREPCCDAATWRK